MHTQYFSFLDYVFILDMLVKVKQAPGLLVVHGQKIEKVENEENVNFVISQSK